MHITLLGLRMHNRGIYVLNGTVFTTSLHVYLTGFQMVRGFSLKLMKPVFAMLRGLGYTITSFIDDTLLCNPSQAGSLACINDTIALLQKLGVCVNRQMSVLIPTKCFDYLGNIINTDSLTVFT